jgi:hypothetical protein
MGPHLCVLSLTVAVSTGAAFAQQGDGSANPDRPAPSAPDAQAQVSDGVPPLVVRVEFGAELPGGDDVISAGTELAGPDYVARVDVSPEPDGMVTGTRVFEDVAAFSNWRSDDMEEYFGPIGGAAGVAMDVTVFRPEALRRSDPDSFLGGLEGLSIHYANTGNHAAGDADIDAVTVICTGGDARCAPSN